MNTDLIQKLMALADKWDKDEQDVPGPMETYDYAPAHTGYSCADELRAILKEYQP